MATLSHNNVGNENLTVFLHVGTPKTGTKYTQSMIGLYRKDLASRKLHVGSSGLMNEPAFDQTASDFTTVALHHDLARALRGRFSHGAAQMPSVAQTKESIARDVALGGDVLYSSELFYWDFRSLADIRQVREAFAGLDVRIILTLRNRWYFLESMYAQAVFRQGEKAKIDQFANYHLDSIRYGTLLHRWKSVFGDENVSIINYDQIDDIFLEIIRSCGISLVKDARKNLRLNESVSTLIIEPLRECNNAGISFDQLVKKLEGSAAILPKYRIISEELITSLARRLERSDRVLVDMVDDADLMLSSERYLAMPHVEAADYKAMSLAIGLVLNAPLSCAYPL
jgi:hypothetical protein